MLDEIIKEALTKHGFKLIHKTDSSGYYICEQGQSIRFSVLHKLDELPGPAELNAEINKNAPHAFIEHPAFKKNCDLICTLKLTNLSDFKGIEQNIFAIEEDPYHYKKYVLYYSQTESEILNNLKYSDLLQVIGDKPQFDVYKNDPLSPSKYSLAAKVFIKLPFLELPHKNRELVPLKRQAEEAVSEVDGLDIYKKIQESPSDDLAIETLVEDLIRNELENIAD